MKAFRKIIIVTLLLVLGGMLLAGCGKSDAEPTESTTGGTSLTTQTGTTAGTTTDASGETTKETTAETGGNAALKDLAFIYRENVITLSDIVDDEKMESLLGKADEIKSHTYSKDDGLNMDPLNGMTEKQYKFPGLVVKTIDAAKDKKFFIFNIQISSPNYPTSRKIKVGDSFEKLKEAYPEGHLTGGELGDGEDDFRYEPVDYVDVMSFHIKDKKVESILIYKLMD